jgi:hypothetical protein
VSPLCSRNARPKKALVGRAQWGAHPILETRYMSKLGRIIVGCSLRPCWTGFLSILRSVFLLSKRYRPFKVRRAHRVFRSLLGVCPGVGEPAFVRRRKAARQIRVDYVRRSRGLRWTMARRMSLVVRMPIG